MSTFVVNQTKCPYHNKPLNLICVNPSCQGRSSCAVMFCSDCSQNGHKLSSVESFSRTFCLLVNDRAIKTPQLKEDTDIIRYSNKVKNYLQLDNLRLIQNIMKCISDDKKYFFEEIDVCTKMAMDEKERIKKTLLKSQYFTYLFNYFSRPELLQLKLQLTNPKALVSFREKFFQMDKLDNDDYNCLKRLQKLKENIIRSCKGRITESATERFKEALKNKWIKNKPTVLMERKNSLQVQQPKRKQIFSRKNSQNKRPPSRF